MQDQTRKMYDQMRKVPDHGMNAENKKLNRGDSRCGVKKRPIKRAIVQNERSETNALANVEKNTRSNEKNT